jgi:hypothetical protein
MPPKPWKDDADLRKGVNKDIKAFRPALALLYDEKGSPNHFALFYRDYKTRLPSDSEMTEYITEKLRLYFYDRDNERTSLNTEKGEDKEGWLGGGYPVLVLRFAGTGPDQVPVEGEVYMTKYHGFGYWLLTWAPVDYLDKSRPALLTNWVGLRNGFSLDSKRDRWIPEPRNYQTLPADPVKVGVEFKAATTIWEKQDWPDPPADENVVPLLRLHGQAPELESDSPDAKKKHISKDAFCDMVVIKKKTADLKEAAAVAEEVYKGVGWEHVELAPPPERQGSARAGEVTLKSGDKVWVARHLAQYLGDDRYVVLVTLRRDEDIVLMAFKSMAMRRQHYWDSEFMEIVDSLRVVKGGAR